MPSFFHFMVGLGGTALAAAVTFLWVHEPQRPPTSPDTFTSSSRVVGKSALSHGSLPPASSSTAAGSFSPAFQIGQKVFVASEVYASQWSNLLPSLPDSPTSTPASGLTRTLPSGTVATVSGMRATERVLGHTEQYYEVTLADGSKGWLSERVLRAATNED